MDILEIIGKKRDKKELTKEEIEYFVKEYTELFFPHEKDNSMYYYAILKKVK